MSGGHRIERVASQILGALSQVLREGVRDPRVTPITLTRVELSPDLRHAYVFFTPLGGQGDAAEILAGLKAASGYLSLQLGRQIRMKFTPKLRFQLDEGMDDMARITAIIDGLEPE